MSVRIAACVQFVHTCTEEKVWTNLSSAPFIVRPVVAAAAIVPATVYGIIDSKKITKESERERIYEDLIRSPGIRYAVAIVSAQRIDEINILQATLEGMRMAVTAVINMDNDIQIDKGNDSTTASAERNESSYVVTGGSSKNKTPNETFHALIDGNRVPKDMPCPSESLVKGDGREYSIGAASILAKVTRDRLMHEYDNMYPRYNLRQHKGEHHELPFFRKSLRQSISDL